MKKIIKYLVPVIVLAVAIWAVYKFYIAGKDVETPVFEFKLDQVSPA